MNQTWINRENNDKCILFFNGWGMDENATSHILPLDYDVCMFNNYNPIGRIILNPNDFKKIFVVAWSLGVWAASKIINEPKIEIEKAIALNGTLKPVDMDKGISPIVFNATYENWNEENRIKFNQRMFGGKKYLMNQSHHLSSRSVECQKEELAYLLIESSARPISDLKYDCALISNRDMIFTAQNQRNFWTDKTRIIERDFAHYPFSKFQTWDEIINL